MTTAEMVGYGLVFLVVVVMLVIVLTAPEDLDDFD